MQRSTPPVLTLHKLLECCLELGYRISCHANETPVDLVWSLVDAEVRLTALAIFAEQELA